MLTAIYTGRVVDRRGAVRRVLRTDSICRIPGETPVARTVTTIKRRCETG